MPDIAIAYLDELPPSKTRGRAPRADIEALFEAAAQNPGIWAAIYFQSKPAFRRAVSATRKRLDKDGPLYRSGVETAARTLGPTHFGVFVRYPQE